MLKKEVGGVASLPDSHRRACEKGGVKMTGNAAGNEEDWLDLTGANTVPEGNPMG